MVDSVKNTYEIHWLEDRSFFELIEAEESFCIKHSAKHIPKEMLRVQHSCLPMFIFKGKWTLCALF